ncbi:DEAD/DEAH box helicase [Brachybacterium phenoliresistens]|uniref:DEAD/DEAH box helicase n=1 Tax=Brachybacterium phenoliresistens TaxID=396014 RepID=UPI0031CFD45E
MTELLPTRQAADLRRAVLDYVTTAISLADPSVGTALDAFLEHEDAGIFKGPYIRTRLPFAAGVSAQEARTLVPTLPEWFAPYAHQATAFSRLTTNPVVPGEQDEHGLRLPQPTIVTTGTGSGKTESFLYPVLDHVSRARSAGIGGIKALILYPMNALANDQAGRLAEAITGTPAYRGITAALYTGEASAQPSTVVTEKSLITDREMIRGSVPDILLTNYKMLDQLLLRRADRPLWEASAASLRYLILDEFHTYDGAQGTDVGMLLRRLRLVLDTVAPGRVHITPVATSATLGDGDDAAGEMLEFAQTVFGSPIGSDAVITETRVGLGDFLTPATAAITMVHGTRAPLTPATLTAEDMRTVSDRHLEPGTAVDADTLTRDLLDVLWRSDDPDVPATRTAAVHGISVRDLLLGHETIGTLLARTTTATALDELARGIFSTITDDSVAREFTTVLLAALSHERARKDAPRNSFPSLEAHLWLREITRVDRLVDTAPAFQWSDAADEESGRALPAIYCRHCGRSGWGATTRAVGDDLELTPDKIRQDAFHNKQRFRALILDITTREEAADRTTEESSRRRFLNLNSATLDVHSPLEGDPDANAIQVLVFAGLDAGEKALEDTCPACGEKDGIRFLGTSLATLLSVALTSLFGTPGLDMREKKALVFTDSVQDAAHRAGFVEARSHSLTLRSAIHSALWAEPATIDQIVDRMIAAAQDDEQRYRLLHPTITDSERLAPFWHQDPVRRRGIRSEKRRRAEELVRSRLRFDVGLELGLTGQVGRTLLLTGSAQAQVRATYGELDQAADRALGASAPLLDGDSAAQRRRWVRGILERLRTHGAISHPWLKKFREDGGPLYRLWGGRPERDVMPAFPPGRAIPQLPSIGPRGKSCEFEDAASRGSWYADWTARALGRDRSTAATFLRPLLDGLVELGILDVVTAGTGGQLRSFAVLPDRLEGCLPSTATADADALTPSLTCSECRETVTGTTHSLAQLDGGPCLRFRCPGRLHLHGIRSTYYRSLYQGDMRRVVAREHTSLLTTEDRLAHETQFKNSSEDPGAPNVLVATPTLEMGIDIGDLSTVLLASVPRTVASYLQRVGRAGRLTGNSLDVTLVAGRGRTAGLFYDPLDLLNGTVRAPGAYLSAEEILRRQFLASVMDALAGDERITPPARTTPILADVGPGTYLGQVVEELQQRGPAYVDRFLAQFTIGAHAWDGLTEQARDALRAWALPDAEGRSGLVTTIERAAGAWRDKRDELRRRRARIQDNLDELEAVPDPEAREETRRVLEAENLLISAEQEILGDETVLTEEEREAERRRLRGTAGRLSAEAAAVDTAHWIGVLEMHGLLPNFTLVDDAVALEATVIWQDDDGTWQHVAATYGRSGMAALTELAPGAHFYAHGRELVIDAVDIGVGGSGLHRTAFCPRCGFVQQFEHDAPPRSCPKCRSQEIADAGQHRDVIDLTRVYSTMNRSRTRIGDSRDDRERVRFETALSASFHEATPLQRWSVPGTGFGMALDRGTTLTRLNLGRPHQVAETIRISGQDRTAPGFLICQECGHHDTDTDGNKPQDHQAWCSLRYEREGRNVPVLLSRTVQTETVLITLPGEVLEDPSGALLINLSAALQLGIETRFGGSIGNVELDVIAHPQHSGSSAVLLSDSIPGGTGYLMELASPQSAWDILVEALDALEACLCQDEGLAACHRCLLPYVRPDEYPQMRRLDAIEALQILLRADRPQKGEMTWAVEEKQPESVSPSESALEARFRRAFMAAAGEIEGASVSTHGSSVSVRTASRTYTLSAQVDIVGTRPDFVLTWSGADVEGIAIYTDGRAFHATTGNNRVGDDAVKRMRLRRAGYVVLTVTHADLEEDSARRTDPKRAYTTPLPSPLVEATVQRWAERTITTRRLAPMLRATPMEVLLDVLQHGTTERLQQLGDELPQLLVSGLDHSSLTVADLDALETIAADLLRGKPMEAKKYSTHLVVGRRCDELAAVGYIDLGLRHLTLVLDDREAAMHRPTFEDSWRTWAQMANLAQGDPHGGTLRLTTMSLVESGIDVTVDAQLPAAAPNAPAQEPSRQVADASGKPTVAPSAPVDADALPGGAPVADAENTRHRQQADYMVLAEPTAVDASGLPPQWQEPYEEVITDTERAIIVAAARLGMDVPVIGEEFGPGIPLDIAWPDLQRAYVVEALPQRDLAALEKDGWRIVGPGADNVLEALGLTEGSVR